MKYVLTVIAVCLAACGAAKTTDVVITEIDVDSLPAEVKTVILAKRADFEIEEVLKKVRDGRTYFDVEGEIADGSELEFDILMTHNGPEIVEIQRDLVFSALADEVQVAAQKAMGDRKIIRIIESIQSDGAVIYELFEEGKPTDPAEEIRVSEGKIERLKERWAH